MRLRRFAVLAVASLTRQFPGHRGSRVLYRLHRPQALADGIEAEIPLEPGLRIRVNSANVLEWLFFFYGARKWEPQIRALIHRYVRSGHAAIDVGANDGIHTLVMAKAVGPEGTVLACEPNPLPCASLRKNLTLNRLSNVLIREIAIGSTAGQVALFVPASDTMQAWASLQKNEADEYLRETRILTVQMNTIDSLADEVGLRNVDLIKIDVEGSEPEVLIGARHLLGRDHPALVFEYTPTWWSQGGHSLEEVLDGLREAGYGQFQEITSSGLGPLRPREKMDILALSNH